MQRTLTADDLRAYERLAGNQFVDPVIGGESLEITGLEILLFLSAKVALPILTGFIGRALYDKWGKPVKPVTREDLEGLRKELARSTAANAPFVNEEEMLHDAVGKLVAEGLTEQRAQAIAEAFLVAASAAIAGKKMPGS